MKAATMLVALAFAAVPLSFAAAPAQAFGWCTAVGPAGHHCYSHYACIGWGWDSRGERCQYGVGPWDCMYGEASLCMPWLP